MTLWHCGTVTLRHDTVTLTLWHCDTVALWYCGTVTLWHCDTAAWHCDTTALWHCGTVTLWHDTVTLTLWHCDTVALWHSGTVTLWHCDTAAWHCDMTLWHTRTVKETSYTHYFNDCQLENLLATFGPTTLSRADKTATWKPLGQHLHLHIQWDFINDSLLVVQTNDLSKQQPC